MAAVAEDAGVTAAGVLRGVGKWTLQGVSYQSPGTHFSLLLHSALITWTAMLSSEHHSAPHPTDAARRDCIEPL